MAARTLAIEFAKLWSDDETCALPQRVTSVSRQGVSFTILDQQDFIQELRTGLYAVDLFLKTVNPDGARRKTKTGNKQVKSKLGPLAFRPGWHSGDIPIATFPGVGTVIYGQKTLQQKKWQ